MLTTILKEARKSKKLKLREITHETGIDQALISKFENGVRRPTFVQLEKLAEILNLDLTHLHTEWLAVKMEDLLKHEPGALKAVMLLKERLEEQVSDKEEALVPIPDAIQLKLDILDMKRAAWEANKPERSDQLSRITHQLALDLITENCIFEGNTMTREEIVTVVDGNLSIEGRTILEFQQVKNTSQVLAYVQNSVRDGHELTEKTIIEIHRLLYKEIDDKHAGSIRTLPGSLDWSRHEPALPTEIDKRLKDLVEWYWKQHTRTHPIILAADFFHHFIAISPFSVGNEQTARMLMVYILLHTKYLLYISKGDPLSKATLFHSIESYLSSGDPVPIYELIIKRAEDSLNRHLALI